MIFQSQKEYKNMSKVIKDFNSLENKLVSKKVEEDQKAYEEPYEQVYKEEPKAKISEEKEDENFKQYK